MLSGVNGTWASGVTRAALFQWEKAQIRLNNGELKFIILRNSSSVRKSGETVCRSNLYVANGLNDILLLATARLTTFFNRARYLTAPLCDR